MDVQWSTHGDENVGIFKDIFSMFFAQSRVLHGATQVHRAALRRPAIASTVHARMTYSMLYKQLWQLHMTLHRFEPVRHAPRTRRAAARGAAHAIAPSRPSARQRTHWHTICFVQHSARERAR